MKTSIKHISILALLVIIASCSDSISEIDADVENLKGETPGAVSNSPFNVLVGNLTQQVGSGQNGCTEYYIHAVAANSIVNYERRARITIIQDAYNDPDTGIPVQPAILTQYVLTIPAGVSVSPLQRILINATEEYDHDFTFRVEEFTDAQGNTIPEANLLSSTLRITNNCYTNQGNGGPWSDDFSDCTFGDGNASCGGLLK